MWISSLSSCQFGVRRLIAVAGAPTAGWSVRVWGRSRNSPKSHDFGYRGLGGTVIRHYSARRAVQSDAVQLLRVQYQQQLPFPY